MSQPLISIIILNWNGKEHIEECLSSVLASKHANLEIIVVDNASTDCSGNCIRKIKKVSLIENSCNVGYAAGNNIGFGAAKGKYIVTLNNDTAVEPEWLDKPLEELEENDTIGVISCRQMDYFNRNIINGLYHYPDKSLLFRAYGNGDPINREHLNTGFVISANGASSIFRKEMLDKIGGFDERFFAYHEDCDIGMRAFLAGWKCLYVPDAVIYHKEGSSFKKRSKTFNYYFERNRLWFLYKYFPLSFLLQHLAQIAIWEMRVSRIKIFKEHIGRQYIRAKADSLKGLSMFKSERHKNISLFKSKQIEFEKFIRNKIIPLKF